MDQAPNLLLFILEISLLHTLQSLSINSEILESCPPYFVDIIPILNVFQFARRNLRVLGFFFSLPSSCVNES